MRILIIAETYPPVLRASARMMRDLAIEFKNNGHDVSVITLVENSSEYDGLKTELFDDDGVEVLRIKTLKLRGVSFVRRGISEELLPYIVNRISLKYFRNYRFDLIITYSPPINLYKVVDKYKKISSCKNFLVLRDIHPQTGKDLGIITNEWLFKFYRHKEKRLYSASEFIAVQSPANKEFLLQNNRLSSDKVTVIYNWKNTSKPHSVHTIDYRKKLGLEDKVICLYGGNMSVSQDLGELLDVAEGLSHIPNCVFLVIGFGPHREDLLQSSLKKGLKNIVFMDALPLDKYEELVEQCDIGLIHLNKKFKTQNIPGKLLDYLYAKIPIVAAVNPGNDIGVLIDEARCGYACTSGDIASIKECIQKLCDDDRLRKQMGQNGREYLERSLSPERAYDEIMGLIFGKKGDKK